MSLFIEVIQMNYIILITCAMLFTFLFSMRTFDPPVKNRMLAITGTLTTLAAADIINYICKTVDGKDDVRLVVFSLANALGVFLAMELSLMIRAAGGKKIYGFMYIPSIIALVFFVAGNFTGQLIYFINDKGFLSYGWLGYTVALFYVFYAGVIIYSSIEIMKRNGFAEAVTLLLGSLLCITMLLLDAVHIFPNTRNSTTAVISAFLYMYIFARRHSTDVLTGCLQRRCFYSDGVRYAKKKKFVVSVDMNGLKTINDNYGHKEGDIGLKTVAEVMKSCLSEREFLYRIGGDEFAILGIKEGEEEAKNLIKRMNEELEKTRYACSFGYAICEAGEDLDSKLSEADQQMYIVKDNFYKEKRKQQS